MENLNINYLEFLLTDSDNFTEDVEKYFDIKYIDGDYELIPKENIGIVLDNGNVVTRHGLDIKVNDRRGFPVNSEWSVNNSYKTRALRRTLINPLTDLIIDIERKNRIKKYRNKITSKKYSKIIISCGDSWWQHPLNKDVIDCIDSDYSNCAIYCNARAGREFSEIIREKEYVAPLKMEPADYFLLSASGNDILGDVTRFLNPNNSDKFEDLFNSDYKKKMEQLEDWYHEILNDIFFHSKTIKKVFINSYDYVVPNFDGDKRSGKWLGKPMKKIGITDHKLQKKIVKKMIDDLSEIILKVSKENKYIGKVELLDFRNKISDIEGWYDEIHPNKSSNQVLAKIIVDKMK